MSEQKRRFTQCPQCKGKLMPNECGCETPTCHNYAGKWPKPKKDERLQGEKNDIQ